MEEKNKIIEDEVGKIDQKKYAKVNSTNSKMYYFAFALLNILTLFIVFLIIKNNQFVEDFDVVCENITFRSIVLIFGIFSAVMFLKTLPTFLSIYNKTKRKMFWISYKCEGITEFFSFSTVYSSGKRVVCSEYLNSKNIDKKLSIDISYFRLFYRGLSKLIYFLVVFILGMIFCGLDIGLFGLIAAITVLSLCLFKYLIVLLFVYNRNFIIKIITKLSGLLFKLHLIKDRELFYNNQVNNLILYTKACKDNKILAFTQMMSCVLEYFLKGMMMYVILVTLNMGDVQSWGKVLFGYVILQLIIDMWPLQKGALIYEFVFMTIFRPIFFSGYVFWAMILFRIFDYFVYVMQYLLILFCDKIFKSKKVKLKKGE